MFNNINMRGMINNNIHLLNSLKKLDFMRYVCDDISSNSHGLRILCVSNEDATIFSAGIFTGAGSLLEEKDELGVAHFLEHMTFKGTVKYPNNTLTNTLDEIGATYNATTTYASTNYEIHGLPFYKEKIVDILIDMYFNSNITDEEVDKERHVIIEEYNMRNDVKGSKIYKSLMNLITAEKYQLYN